ncbi:MAG: radical SAM protein [Deltaproteobacteria bacterium]|nr:radical SAM protein [Deltaproteobacteria bacterium]
MEKEKQYKQAYIEITNSCNLKCSFCPQAQQPGGYYMPPEVFAKIATQVAPLSEQVYLHVLGEPLCHPQLKQIIEICADLALPVQIVTNGALLTKEIEEILLHKIIKQVNFSIHALAENYPAEKAAEITKKIANFVLRALEEIPDLYINYRLWSLHTLGEQQEALSQSPLIKCLEQAHKIDFSVLNKPRRHKGIKLCGRLYVHSDTRFKWPDLNSDQVPDNKGYCHALSNQFAILSNATVVPCCLDYKGVMALGNCLEEPLENILSNTRGTVIKQGFEAGLRIENLCKKCDYARRFRRI